MPRGHLLRDQQDLIYHRQNVQSIKVIREAPGLPGQGGLSREFIPQDSLHCFQPPVTQKSLGPSSKGAQLLFELAAIFVVAHVILVSYACGV